MSPALRLGWLLPPASLVRRCRRSARQLGERPQRSRADHAGGTDRGRRLRPLPPTPARDLPAPSRQPRRRLDGKPAAPARAWRRRRTAPRHAASTGLGRRCRHRGAGRSRGGCERPERLLAHGIGCRAGARLRPSDRKSCGLGGRAGARRRGGPLSRPCAEGFSRAHSSGRQRHCVPLR